MSIVLVLAVALAVAGGCGGTKTPKAPTVGATSAAQNCPLSHSIDPWNDMALNEQFIVRQGVEEFLITVEAAVLSDTAFTTLSASFDGTWSVASGGLSLQGPPAGQTVLGVRGAGDVHRAPNLPVVACDRQGNAYSLTTVMTYDNDPANFMWLFDVGKESAPAGPYRLVVNRTVVVDLGSLSNAP